ncbi:MAG: hypothetical protein IH845_05545 [Nanoarchaeota archaeon]|nr:hypothetical protein [Nanoarchaeota archaeon]
MISKKEVKEKMEVIQVSREAFVEKCLHCDKKLKPANSEKTATANLKQHLLWCEKNPENKK